MDSNTDMFSVSGFEAEIDALPGDVEAVLAAVRGALVHGDDLSLYGLEEPAEGYDRTTLSLAGRLRQLKALDPAPLGRTRAYDKRAVGTCRDYALMTSGLLRRKGMAARVRCGFAPYLVPGFVHDHWICEYRESPSGPWRRADAQLDDVQRRALDIRFDTANMSEDAFLTAGEAWNEMRQGRMAADRFGHGDAVGEWFMWVNLARDRLAREDRVTSPWDGWRAAKGLKPQLTDDERARCDGLADGTGEPGAPFWME